jgi:hypothetical protein
MSANCTTCGHAIPSGQFRCGKCGAAQARDSSEDFAALSELAEDQSPDPRLRSQPPRAREAASRAWEAVSGLHLGIGPEIKARAPSTAAASAQRAKPVTEEAAAPAPAAAPPREEEKRESSVPKGTFASSSEVELEPEAKPEPVAEPPKKERNGKKPRVDATTQRVVTSAGSSQPRRARHAPPPFLASAILREDLAPSEPGKDTSARVLLLSGLLGVCAALFGGGGTPTLVFVPVFLLVIVMSRLNLSYVTRAIVTGSVSGAALFIASFWRVALGGRLEGPFLSAAVTLLSAALFFRAWYRGSTLARVLVAGSLVLALSWAGITSHRGLLELGFDWASWLPALTWYLFVILCLLSLLAFMGNETTGGCDTWALGLFAWFGLYALVRHALDAYVPGSVSLLGLLEPALAAPAAVSLAQLLARAFGPRDRRVEQALTS